MSKDQLSWENLFSQEPGEAEAGSQENTAASTESEQSSQIATPKKKRTKKVKVESSTTVAEGKTEYSKKNWAKLEFNSSPEEAKAELTKQETTTVREDDIAEVKVTKTTQVAVTIPPKPQVEPEPEEEKEPDVLTVSELNKHIRDILEGRFKMIWVKAEISNFKAHTSGHFYFSLKDSKAQISAVMFRGFNNQLKFRPEDGMEVLVRGKITVYEPRGNYQIFCEMMEPVGAGALQKAYEQLKAKLQREGLFDQERKRPLPALPKHIAIVTSPTGAAIRDMLNVVSRRFKGAQITLVPCKVQGDAAPGEIVEAIKLANRIDDVDVMIVGRGGGSIEDLWAFNDERVARAIAASRVPVISAVGHEVDFTIADFVADLRAPTPSAAAELVVRNAADLVERIANLSRSLRFRMAQTLQGAKQYSTSIAKRLVDPQRRIQDAAMRCDELMQRLEASSGRYYSGRRLEIALLKEKLGTPIPRIQRSRDQVVSFDQRMKSGMRNHLSRKRELMSKQVAVLDSLSPLKVLDRGYSMVTVGDAIITEASSLKVGQAIEVRMCQGRVEAQVTKVITKSPIKE